MFALQFGKPGCCEKSHKCKYGFPAGVQSNYKPMVDEESGRYQYYRPRHCDRNVVPYHPTVALLWNAHCNVQLVTNKEWSYYLLKYAMKVGCVRVFLTCMNSCPSDCFFVICIVSYGSHVSLTHASRLNLVAT